MKRYKPLLIQVSVLLLILVGFLFLINRKQFVTVDFPKQYLQNRTIELAGFEEGERWQGNLSYDSGRVLEGKSSITLSSWYGKTNSIEKEQKTTLPPGYINGYLSVYVADKKNIDSFSSLSLDLVGDKDQKKTYDLAPLLHIGWNRIAIPIPVWNSISKKTFTLLSKPGVIAEVSLDRFWIENSSLYSSETFSHPTQALSLRTIGERTYLFSSSPKQEQYIFNNPPSIQKGSIMISLIPEHGKKMVMSLNGTSMEVSGTNMNECLLYKNDDVPASKILQKTSGKDDLYVFLKAEVQDNKITYSVSNNGYDFEKCGVVPFSQNKPIGISLEGSYLIDSYSAEY